MRIRKLKFEHQRDNQTAWFMQSIVRGKAVKQIRGKSWRNEARRNRYG